MAVVLVLALAAPARGQTAVPDEKEPVTALVLSLSATVVGWGAVWFWGVTESEPIGLLGAALVIAGPSIGQIYGGASGRGWAQIGIRTVASCLFVLGVGNSLAETDHSAAVPLMAAGGLILLGSTLFSIIDAPRAARQTNERRRRLIVAPAPVSGPLGSTGIGLVLAGEL